MAYEEEIIVQEWLDHLKGLDVHVKKMFGCYCLYCDGQAVGWIHDSVLSLREVLLDYLPEDIPRRTRSLTDIPLRRILRMSGSIRANGITMYPCRRVPGDGKA